MDRELRHIVTGIDAARFAPDLLAMTIEIVKLVGTNCDIIELLQQAEAGEFADRMRQGIDANAEFADSFRLLEELAANPRNPQHQRPSNASAATTADKL